MVVYFEPDEAEEIHYGTVNDERRQQKRARSYHLWWCSVLLLPTSADRSETTLTRMEQNIYAQAGTTGQIFASTGSSFFGEFS